MTTSVVLTVEAISTQLTAFDLFRLLADEPRGKDAQVPTIDSIKRGLKDYFFLDSGMDAQRLGRYSFIGLQPFLVYHSKGRSLWLDWGDRVEQRTGNPFDTLKEILDRFQSPPPPKNLPFAGGGVGYFGYPLCHFIEELPSTTCDDLALPDCYIAFYDVVVAFDHLHNTAYLCQSHLDEASTNRCQQQVKKLRSILESTPQQTVESESGKFGNNTVRITHYASRNLRSPIRSNITKAEYFSAVQHAKKYIAAGDIYQVNLSQRFSTAVNLPPVELYSRLRQVSPAPFGAYLHCGNFQILSASPERFLRFSPDNRTVETRPIKGTRPRGNTPEEDQKLARELLHSEKDRAELLMIVDLERNDLGRVCEIGSVRVPELMTLESYANVHHLVATVTGTLRADNDRIDLLRSCFPGGSITGAPKIRAMEVIDELEPMNRGVYTGAIGYLGFDGGMDVNIAIRTCVVKNRMAYFHAGGGIVADSHPAAEYQETLDKAQGWFAALKGNVRIEGEVECVIDQV